MEKYYTLTENGAIQFNTTGSYNLDLFASIGSCREMAMNTPDILIKKFWEAYTENPINAIAILFWARAVRNGAGERKVFEVLIKEVCNYFPEFIIDNISSIVELGRWSDLEYIYNTNTAIKTAICEYWSTAIKNKNALACKWLSKNTELYKDVQKSLQLTNAEMRRWIAKYSKTVEQQMCAKNWKEIDYSKIPSQALNLYKDAFLRNDKEHYIQDITTKKVNAGAIYPHEILWNYAKFAEGCGWNNRDQVLNETVEAMWKVLPNYINKDMRFITVCDCSGSMTCRVGKFNALSIARALSIYCAERLEGVWKDKAILFSSYPKFIDCSECKTLVEKNNVYNKFDDCSNTNLEAVFKLILDAAKTCKDKSTIPNTILVLSDMQMDSGCGRCGRDISFMESMRAEYKLAGVEFPSIIWWNLYETNTGFVDSKYDNVAFASGFNPKIMQAVFEGMKVEYSTEGEKKVKIDPMVVMNKALDSIMKILKLDNLKTNIPQALKGIQLNKTIGQSIRCAAKKVSNSDTFLDRIQELSN